MPWFYFDLRTPHGLDHDEIGLELVDVETAYLEAYAGIESMANDLFRCGTLPVWCTFEIRDAKNRLLMEVPFSEALGQWQRSYLLPGLELAHSRYVGSWATPRQGHPAGGVLRANRGAPPVYPANRRHQGR